MFIEKKDLNFEYVGRDNHDDRRSVVKLYFDKRYKINKLVEKKLRKRDSKVTVTYSVDGDSGIYNSLNKLIRHYNEGLLYKPSLFERIKSRVHTFGVKIKF